MRMDGIWWIVDYRWSNVGRKYLGGIETLSRFMKVAVMMNTRLRLRDSDCPNHAPFSERALRV